MSDFLNKLRNHEKSQTIVLCLVVLAAFLLFAWMFLTIRCQDMQLESDPIFPLTDQWTVEYGNTREIRSLPSFPPVKSGETVTYTKTLEEQEGLCNTVMFYTGHQYVKVYLSGELLYTYGENQTVPFPMSVGSGWQCIRLPLDWQGKELKIELVSSYEDYSGNLEIVYLGTKSALVFHVVYSLFQALLWCVPLIVIGLALIFFSAIFREQRASRRLRVLGAAAIVTCLWMVLESQVSQIFVSRNLLSMNMIFLLFGLIPVLFSRYLLTYDRISQRNSMHISYWYAVFTYLLIQILQVSGILDYLHTVPLVHIAIVLVIVSLLDAFFHRSRQKGATETPVFIASFVFAFFGIVDIIRYYIAPLTRKTIFFTRFGLILFFIILGCSAIMEASKEHHESLHHQMLMKLAYTDILTGLPNRTAYEEEKERYVQNESECPLFMMLLDLNNLKSINDHYGHAEGDKAIIRLSEHLQACFPEKLECFRIGGDEFCVLSRDRETRFKQKLEALDRAMQKDSGLFPYAFTVARGYVQTKAADLDDAFHTADQNMYTDKLNIKKLMAAENTPFSS